MDPSVQREDAGAAGASSKHEGEKKKFRFPKLRLKPKSSSGPERSAGGREEEVLRYVRGVFMCVQETHLEQRGAAVLSLQDVYSQGLYMPLKYFLTY